MRKAPFETELNESGEAETEIVNATAEEIKEQKATPPAEEERVPFNPYTSEAINDKSYTQPPPVDPNLVNSPIEEPVNIPPPPPPPPSEPNAPPPPPFNPELKGLSDKDKNTAATRAADMAIQMYEWLHDLGNKAVQVSESKLNKLEMQGLIDLRAPININGEQMTLYQFVNNFNTQMNQSFVVSEEFKKQVRPLLIEIFEKRGVGMTTEQQLVFIVCKDLAGKLTVAYVMIQQRKDLLKGLAENTAAWKAYVKAGGPTNHNAPPPPPPPPPPAQEPTYNGEVFNEEPFTPPPPPPPPAPMFNNINVNDVVIPEPEEGVPGELNANSYVEKTINPGRVKKGSVEGVDNSVPGKSRGRRKNRLI